MKSTIISCLLIILTMPIFSQIASDNTKKIQPWMGEFTGTLTMYASSKYPGTISMKIRNFETDTAGTYGWNIIYGEDESKGTRAYFLKEVDVMKGHYVVDEQNSILLDSYLIGNKLISDFEVEGSTITSIYTLVDTNTMTFEIIAGKSSDANITGGVEDIPEVTSHLVSGYHFAELKRISPPDK